MMVSGNGSLYMWVPRPAKYVQPLSPNFTEIEENVLYVEREDEFEQEESSDDDTQEEAIKDGGLGMSLITSSDGQSYSNLLKPLSKKQRKLARKDVDIDTIDPLHLARQPQVIASINPCLVEPGFSFPEDFKSEDVDMKPSEPALPPGIHPIPLEIHGDDSFAVIARRNIEAFRAKFDKLLQTS